MIKYTLKCSSGCQFEVWFANSASCDEQLQAGHVTCPNCGDANITKALMAPNISSAVEKPAPPSSPPAPVSEPNRPAATPPSPEAARRIVEERLYALRAYVEANADNVGDSFADEARRIHEGDADPRAIYGDATPDEVEELIEDGVPLAQLPWINRRDD